MLNQVERLVDRFDCAAAPGYGDGSTVANGDGDLAACIGCADGGRVDGMVHRRFLAVRRRFPRLFGFPVDARQHKPARNTGLARVVTVTATAHKLARIVYALMRHGMGYVKQTEQVYVEQTRQKMEKQFHRRAKELGYEVRKLEPSPILANP